MVMVTASSRVVVTGDAVLWRLLASATGTVVGAGGIVMSLLSDWPSSMYGCCTLKGFMTATGRCWLSSWGEKKMGLKVSSVVVFELVLMFSVGDFCGGPWFVVSWWGFGFLPARRPIWFYPIYDQYPTGFFCLFIFSYAYCASFSSSFLPPLSVVETFPASVVETKLYR